MKGVEVAKFIHEDSKALLYAGLLHDVGKTSTDPESLKKTEGFNGKDMEELKKHPTRGYELLRGIHDFSAEVIVRHHQYNNECYPKQLPKCKVPFSKGTMVKINYFSRVLGLIDFYDSLRYRKDDKFSPGKARTLSKTEAKDKLLEHNPDLKHMIHELYTAKIFK